MNQQKAFGCFCLAAQKGIAQLHNVHLNFLILKAMLESKALMFQS